MTVSDDITFIILLRQAEFLYKKSTNLNNNPRMPNIVDCSNNDLKNPYVWNQFRTRKVSSALNFTGEKAIILLLEMLFQWCFQIFPVLWFPISQTTCTVVYCILKSSSARAFTPKHHMFHAPFTLKTFIIERCFPISQNFMTGMLRSM